MAEVTIRRLGHLGDGIAEDETGAPVYAPRTLPGEVVAGEVEGNRIDAPRILTPSPDRVRAPCPHYRSCGSCQLQHASDGFVATWKREVVTAALAAQGLSAPVLGPDTSPERSRRRATLAGRRLKSGALVGFHGARSGTVVPIPDCRVLSPDLIACLPALEAMVREGGSRKGEMSLALTASDTGIDCAVSGGRALDTALLSTLPRHADTFLRLTWNGETVFAAAPPRFRFGTAEVEPPPGAFLQATKAGEAALTAAVMEAVEGAAGIVDLFAGCGTFTLPLAATAPVHAVEGEAALTATLDRAARHAAGLKPVTVETRDLFRRPLTPDELSRYDAAVIDPPRAGAEAQTAELARARIPRIAMVSCNPVTFARDAKLLAEAGYRIEQVQVVDQFRWSTHVELAAALRLT
ncbi:class I SAM-dependent RNA methyltransferase [Rhodobacterales bacterium HKCCE2091]|nr:class I SAM-dependent RNA methyltransferase [Rhodobacterales bacterium HKCCE2091]